MLFYKFLNKNWKHNNFQYKLGLNIDDQPFNPNGSGQSGGMYYTIIEFVFSFAWVGDNLAQVRPAEDAQVYADPNGKMWKTDKLIIDRVYSINDWGMWNNSNFCSAVFKQSWTTIRFAKIQTNEMCLEAVKKGGLILKFIKEQTEEICLATIRQNGLCLQFVKEQTGEICLLAVRQNNHAMTFVKILLE